MPIDTYILFPLFNIQRVNQLLFREIQFLLFVSSLKRYKFDDKCKKKKKPEWIWSILKSFCMNKLNFAHHQRNISKLICILGTHKYIFRFDIFCANLNKLFDICVFWCRCLRYFCSRAYSASWRTSYTFHDRFGHIFDSIQCYISNHNHCLCSVLQENFHWLPI